MRRDDILNLLAGSGSIAVGVFALYSMDNQYKNSPIYIFILLCAVFFAASAAFFSIYLSSKNKKKNRVFIGYSLEDRGKALEITEKIKKFGFNPWFSDNEILPGQNFIEETKKGIEKSAVFLLVLSSSTNNSKLASKELEMAISLMRSKDRTFSPVIPIIIDDTPVPESLKGICAVDLRYNEEEGYGKLEKALEQILGRSNNLS